MTDSGVTSVPEGTEIQIIAADGVGYKGSYKSMEFPLGPIDFDEK